MRVPVLAGLFLLAAFSSSADPLDSVSSEPKEASALLPRLKRELDSIDRKLVFYTGKVQLADGAVELTVPEGFYFIAGDQARFILEEIWGNMPDMDVAGMLVRTGFEATRLDNDHSFVISYSNVGYITDSKNIQLDHNQLLETLEDNMKKSNVVREEMGYNTMKVTGWVMVPYYDSFKKALYWASRIRANGSEEEILNYNLRLLGKNGVIKINAVATMDQLAAIKQELPAIIAQTRFAQGQSYADFKPGTDTASTWTMPEMVAGYQSETNGLPSTAVHLGWIGLAALVAGSGGIMFTKLRKRKAVGQAV
ncbi:DUF2167 domain-containing protein [Flavihumibacter petaseus]|nr:DUF2167 domain-containing protein [Flavihumibacter petaseus]